MCNYRFPWVSHHLWTKGEVVDTGNSHAIPCALHSGRIPKFLASTGLESGCPWDHALFSPSRPQIAATFNDMELPPWINRKEQWISGAFRWSSGKKSHRLVESPFLVDQIHHSSWSISMFDASTSIRHGSSDEKSQPQPDVASLLRIQRLSFRVFGIKMPFSLAQAL